ncbi:MAG: aspartate carbamoyltransferase catalytic subunit [Steroidobacteraceae bacterium]|jgi:aspartate carbamoyltransferase catalytic subunit
MPETNTPSSNPWRSDGSLRHLLTLEGLSRSLLERLLERSAHYSTPLSTPAARSNVLSDKTVALMFAEPSTRTRVSFELAARRLGAEVINIEVQLSSRLKGESVLDTVATLESMHVDAFILRDSDASIPELVATHVAQHVSVISGGAGSLSHPTQGLLDALTVKQHLGRIEGLSIAIVGDVKHSRVARSAAQIFTALGAGDVRLVAPAGLMPTPAEFTGCSRFDSFDQGIENCDVVMMLRIQKERMAAAAIPDEARYFQEWGLTQERLRRAKPGALVMHPQPMNRGVEIASDVADGAQSVIRDQVRNGVAVRMAVLETLMVGR